MAALIAPRFRVLIVLGTVAALAQDLSRDPVPTWPEDGNIPVEYRDRYVFLSKDRHAIIVLVPTDAEKGMEGPKTTIKVPLKNDLDPSVTASVVVPPSGRLSYRYTVENSARAGDSIGAFKLIVPPADLSRSVKDLPTNGKAAWGGSAAQGPPATLAIAKQAIFTDAPQGKYVLWFQHDDNVIHPGTTLGGFVVESSYLPGLTTAWLSSGQLVEFDQSWPREIFQQLQLLEDLRFREVSRITIGPMFASDEPKDQIAATFYRQIHDMLTVGALDGSSSFAKEVSTNLTRIRQSSAERTVIKSRPHDATESMIAMALRFTLGMEEAER